MHYSTLLYTLATLAAASPISERSNLEARANNAAAILSDWANAKTDTINFNNTLNTVDDNAFFIFPSTAAQMQSELQALQNDLQSAVYAAGNSSTLTAAQSTSMVNAMKANENAVFTMLSNVIAHKGAVTNSGATSTVESALETENDLIQSLFTNLEKKVVKTAVSPLKTIQKLYASKFSVAIADFAS